MANIPDSQPPDQCSIPGPAMPKESLISVKCHSPNCHGPCLSCLFMSSINCKCITLFEVLNYRAGRQVTLFETFFFFISFIFIYLFIFLFRRGCLHFSKSTVIKLTNRTIILENQLLKQYTCDRIMFQTTLVTVHPLLRYLTNDIVYKAVFRWEVIVKLSQNLNQGIRQR